MQLFITLFRKFFLQAIGGFLTLAVLGGWFWQPDDKNIEQLSISTPTGSVLFNVEIADEAHEQKKGLMHREFLPEDQGMLFDFVVEQHITMWMKDTPLSLDMIFIDTHGKITHIAEHTTPYSQTLISSRSQVRAVLEVLSGMTQKHGIQPGQYVQHSIFR